MHIFFIHNPQLLVSNFLFVFFLLYAVKSEFHVQVHGKPEVVPYGNRASYLKFCDDHNIGDINECADTFEQKGLERLEYLETLYKQFMSQNRENIDLKQTNKILLQERKAQNGGDAVCDNSQRNETGGNYAEEQYRMGLTSINVQSVRNHFCREAIRSLPTEVLEPVLDLDIEPIPMLKQLSQREELLVLLNQLKLHGEIAELGVHRGEFSENILAIWKHGRLHMIDAWEKIDHYLYDRNDDMNQAINRVSKYGSDRYKIVRNYTTHAAFLYPDNYFDFLYLDATHTYFEARRDIQMWWPKLKRGGIFSGDDYVNGNVKAAGYRFGVKDAVDEFAAVYNLRVNLMWRNTKPELGGPMPQWYIYKC